MNKGRSRVFSERMKGVFKSRSRVVNSKIPENLNSGTEFEGRTINSDCNKNIPEFNSGIKGDSNGRSFQSVVSSSHYGNLNVKSNCLRNEKVPTTPEEKLYKGINDHYSGSCNDERGGLVSHNELHIKSNGINKSCQSCLPKLDINQNSNNFINDRLRLSQNMTTRESGFNNNNNNNNNNYSSLRVQKSHRCDIGMCHFCLKQICVCENGNLISNRGNYIHSPEGSFRFSQVLQNAFGEEKNNRNEFIILALGIQHYIKEVFNALDYNNNGYVSYEDLRILCKILGKDLEYESNTDVSFSSCETEDNDNQICSNNSCKSHLHFEKFSDIICSKFSKLSTSENCLEKRKNTQLVNAVVNISRRSESLSVISNQLEELENDYLDLKNKNRYFTLPSINNSVNNCSSCTKYQLMAGTNNSNHIHLENMKLQKIILLQQQELQCLREVIEDLRISLQCSDAENLSLRVKEVKLNTKSISEDQLSKVFTLSTEDDKDSIDRIIHSFPSSEDLNMSSNDSLLTIRSLQSRPSSRSAKQIKSSQIDIDARSNILVQKISEKIGDDDLGLNKEIQLVYQELSEERSQLEETRTDLELTVSEIQTKNDQINRLTRNLNDLKKNFDNSIVENSNLKEKIVLLKNIEKNKVTQIDILEQQVFELKAQLISTDEHTKSLSKELQTLKLKRKRELEQMAVTRNLIAKSLATMNKNENISKSSSIEKSKIFPSKSDAILENDNQIFENKFDNKFSDCDNNNNNRTIIFPTVNRRINDCNENELNVNFGNLNSEKNRILNSEKCPKISFNSLHASDTNYRLKDHSRLNLSPCVSRRREFNSNESSSPVSSQEVSTAGQKGNEISKEGRGETSLTTFGSLKEKPLSLGTLGTSAPEDKPTLEVKPHLIRPIGIMKPISKDSSTFFKTPPTFSKAPSTSCSTRSRSTEDLKEINLHTDDKKRSLTPELNYKLINQPPKIFSTKDNTLQKAPKTSTQILEGLEAEVAYLLSML